MRRRAAVGACVSTCAGWLVLGLVGSASAAPVGQCTTHTGTIVAVDFAHWGGPIVRGCGLRQRTDYDLLHAAGFSTAGDQDDGPGFICRLGDQVFHHGAQYPTARQERCILTPPASAYWSYWVAPAGQNHWDYSQLGAMSQVPKPGEVELWTFGATNIAGTRGSGVPSFSPGTLRAHNATMSSSSTGPAVVDAKPTTQHASSGSAAPLVIGIALAALLCAGAGWAVWRRRRYE